MCRPELQTCDAVMTILPPFFVGPASCDTPMAQMYNKILQLVEQPCDTPMAQMYNKILQLVEQHSPRHDFNVGASHGVVSAVQPKQMHVTGF